MSIISDLSRHSQRHLAHHKSGQNVYTILLLGLFLLKKKLFLSLGGFKTQLCGVFRGSIFFSYVV